MGRAYNELGNREEALKCLNEALSLWRGQGEAQSRPHQNLKQLIAQKHLNGVLPNLRDASGRAGEASTLDNLGKTYSEMGQDKEALEYFNQALPLWRDEGERGGEALTLNNMGRAYADLGEKQKSLDVYDRAIAAWREVGNRQGEALTLNNIGRLYRDLGQHQTALDYLQPGAAHLARGGQPQRRGAGAERYRQGLRRPAARGARPSSPSTRRCPSGARPGARAARRRR